MSATSARWRVGVVIGKFYPPHRGHKYLIDTAAAAVEELTVIVCGKAEQLINGDLRAAWLRAIHPTARVLAIDDHYPDDDSRLWAALTVGWLGGPPDVVFTSEGYGDAYARYLGCDHILVDRARRIVPCSGTAIRADPLAHWAYLEPPVRGFLAKRVCLVGAESTGKTTLAAALAAHYRTAWVPEYGREYAEAKLARGEYDAWTSDEFTQIAAEQCRREDAAACQSAGLLICDTDAFATSIWHRRYLGALTGGRGARRQLSPGPLSADRRCHPLRAGWHARRRAYPRLDARDVHRGTGGARSPPCPHLRHARGATRPGSGVDRYASVASLRVMLRRETRADGTYYEARLPS